MLVAPTPTRRIRVLLADDHAVLRIGLERLLAASADIDVVGGAADGQQAVELASKLRPDVVVMDICMPNVNGVEATRRIVAARPDTRVVVLTSFADRSLIHDAVAAGAVGYLLKDADPDELLAGIRSAAGAVPRDDTSEER